MAIFLLVSCKNYRLATRSKASILFQQPGFPDVLKEKCPEVEAVNTNQYDAENSFLNT